MKTFVFKQEEWKIKRMTNQSLLLEDNATHITAFISRKVLNKIIDDPNNLCSLIERTHLGEESFWIATMLTI